MLPTIALYIRNKGFVPTTSFEETLPLQPVPERPEVTAVLPTFLPCR